MCFTFASSNINVFRTSIKLVHKVWLTLGNDLYRYLDKNLKMPAAQVKLKLSCFNFPVYL